MSPAYQAVSFVLYGFRGYRTRTIVTGKGTRRYRSFFSCAPGVIDGCMKVLEILEQPGKLLIIQIEFAVPYTFISSHQPAKAFALRQFIQLAGIFLIGG